MCWLLLLRLHWCRGATGSFPDSAPPPIDIGIGGFQGLLPKNKAAWTLHRGLQCLAVGLLSVGYVHIFDSDSLSFFPPVGEGLGDHPEDKRSKG